MQGPSEPRRMTGLLSVGPAVTPDGERQVITTLPTGAAFLLPRETALAFAFAVLMVARDLYASPAELDAAVTRAYDRSHTLVNGRPQ